MICKYVFGISQISNDQYLYQITCLSVSFNYKQDMNINFSKNDFLTETCLRSLPVRTRISYWFNSKFLFICISMSSTIHYAIFIIISYFHIIIKTYIVHIILALVVCMKLTLKNEINEVQLKIDENIKAMNLFWLYDMKDNFGILSLWNHSQKILAKRSK